MNKISIKDFKAHKDLTIEFNEKSFLLYGDNGAGKSSIYEALKYVFFQSKIEAPITAGSTTEEDKRAVLTEFRLQYNNTMTRNDFTITADDDSLNVDDYQVSMIQLDDTSFDKYLNLDTLLKKVYFGGVNDYLQKYSEIESATNELLANFLESTKIRVNLEDSVSIP
jgi:DNA repair exonuclease SbcCD ATPase subunit